MSWDWVAGAAAAFEVEVEVGAESAESARGEDHAKESQHYNTQIGLERCLLTCFGLLRGHGGLVRPGVDGLLEDGE